MLGLLREIDVPVDFQFTGNWIKGSLMDQVSDYQTLVATAHRHIQEMRDRAKLEIETQRTEVIEDVAKRGQNDLQQFLNLFEKRRMELESNSAMACMEVSRMAIAQFIKEAPEKTRLNALIELLLGKIQSRSSFTFRVHPGQVELVETLIAEKFSSLLKLSKWQVIPDSTVAPDRLVVDSAGESYIDVSVENWLAILGQELLSLKGYFDAQATLKQGQS